MSEPAVIRSHALRNALLPAITEFAELLPTLVAGAVVVEVVFALPGMGRLLALFLADVLYLWADPRIRWQA